MKVRPGDIDRIIAKPAASLNAALIYGPDEGLVRERGRALVRGLAKDPGDPFLVTQLTPADLKDDPGRVMDELAAIPMMAEEGARRTVWLRGAVDAASKAIEAAFDDEAWPEGAALVVEAGDLGPRSSLRKLFEGAGNEAAAMPCYADDMGALDKVIRDTLKADGLTVEDEALHWLVEHLGADRALTRTELQKLALYMGAGTDKLRNPVTLADAEAAVGDSAALAIDQIVDNCLIGALPEMDRALRRATAEGLNGIQILRSLSGELLRLHQVQADVTGGANMDAAIKGLRPPLYFKRQANFKAALHRWPMGRLGQAIHIVTEAEIDMKTTGLPGDAILARTLQRLATAAANARR